MGWEGVCYQLLTEFLTVAGGEHSQVIRTDEPLTTAPTQKLASTFPNSKASSADLGNVACSVAIFTPCEKGLTALFHLKGLVEPNTLNTLLRYRTKLELQSTESRPLTISNQFYFLKLVLYNLKPKKKSHKTQIKNVDKVSSITL